MEKTKAEGYEALRKIKEILKDFDPEDSYIGKAFEGCVEQAEENLRYDGKMSWKAEYESKDRQVARLTEKLAEVNKKLRESEVARVDLTKELNQKDDVIARYIDVVQGKDREIAELDGELDDKDRTYTDLEGRLEESQRQIGTLKQTILELKAKLYDMMAGEEVEE